MKHMRKNMTAVILMMMCLSLTACGGAEALDVQEPSKDIVQTIPAEPEPVQTQPEIIQDTTQESESVPAPATSYDVLAAAPSCCGLG